MGILPATGGMFGRYYVAVRDKGLLLFEVSDPNEAAAYEKAREIVRKIEIADRILGGDFTNWQPIETAPKTGRVILYCPVRGVVLGDWYDDKYSVRPKPYWTNDLQGVYGVRATRADQPTHWMPLPDRPDEAQ